MILNKFTNDKFIITIEYQNSILGFLKPNYKWSLVNNWDKISISTTRHICKDFDCNVKELRNMIKNKIIDTHKPLQVSLNTSKTALKSKTKSNEDKIESIDELLEKLYKLNKSKGERNWNL